MTKGTGSPRNLVSFRIPAYKMPHKIPKTYSPTMASARYGRGKKAPTSMV